MRYDMSHIRSLESFAADYRRLLDGWQAGGVDGLVIGPMRLNMREGLAHTRGEQSIPRLGTERAAFDSDPAIYAELGVAPAVSAVARGDAVVLRAVAAGMQSAADRGWSVWLMDPLYGAVAPDANHVADRLLDPRAHAALAARMVDTVRAFPMATGVIIDGPSWGFEISEIDIAPMRRRRMIFDELQDQSRPHVARLGYNIDALVAARDQLWRRLHSLEPAQIDKHRDSERPLALAWLGGPDLAEWISMRVDALTAFYEYLVGVLRDKVDRPVQVAVCPRQPAVAALAGYDLERVSQVVDVVKPKLYYWHRGYDGLVGTAYRYARTLISWNPGLSITDACQVARLLFGEAMPVVDRLIDFDLLMTPDYLGALARRELAEAGRAVGDRAGLVPWVDTGRAPHDGDPLTALHLEAIISAVRDSGFDRFTFFNSTNLTAADWAMLSHHGGSDWDPDTSDFVPYDRPTV